MRSPRPANLTAITCCMPRVPICSAASDPQAEAASSYARALELATNDSERRFLERRLREVQSTEPSIDAVQDMAC